MTKIYLALGSNVGDSKEFIVRAITLLGEHVSNIEKAPIYTSKAVGYTNQADFLNTAVCGNTNLDPEQLLTFINKVEKDVGRIKRFRWGPREVDIDIIFYGDQIIDESNLHIPHQRFAERDFVLKPLCDIDPSFVDPRTRQTVKALLTAIPNTEHSIKR